MKNDQKQYSSLSNQWHTGVATQEVAFHKTQFSDPERNSCGMGLTNCALDNFVFSMRALTPHVEQWGLNWNF